MKADTYDYCAQKFNNFIDPQKPELTPLNFP